MDQATTDSLQSFFDQIAECTDKGTLTHQLHPYPAKFIPHIPRALIEQLAVAGRPVLDPMCGSGTTLVEASVAGFDAVGVDRNPIAVLAANAKTQSTDPEARLELLELCERLEAGQSDLRDGTIPDFPNRDKWFEPHVQVELATAKEAILALRSPLATQLALASFSAIIVPVSNQESETRWCAKPSNTSEGETLSRLARKIRKSLAGSSMLAEQEPAPALALAGDCRKLPLQSNTFGLVVTSPPYANSHDYYLYNKLRMFWLGYDVKSVQDDEIGSRNRHSDRKAGIDHYLEAMRASLAEMERVLVPGGSAAVVVADAVIRGEFYNMGVQFKSLGESVGLKSKSIFRFDHKRFNTAFQREFGTPRQKQTHVLVFAK